MPLAIVYMNLTTRQPKSFSGMQSFFSEGVGRWRSFGYFSFAIERKVTEYRLHQMVYQLKIQRRFSSSLYLCFYLFLTIRCIANLPDITAFGNPPGGSVHCPAIYALESP